jgi:hypothetical protein
MRKLMLLFLCVIFYTTAYSQVIKGTILDGHTKNPIMSASIYFNGTFVGTSSDQNGKFELDISNNTSLPLTISSIGYNSVTLKEYAGSERFVISLTPRVYELGEVIIENKKYKKKRRANLKLFKNEFLGTTFNALDCKIINENDITFTYSSDKDTIKAFTSKPIIIHNRSLGYKVTYFLDKFEYYKKSKAVFFYGNIIFNEDLSNDKSQKNLFERRRKQTYLGSRMHFFRALWSNDMLFSGFTVSSSTHNNLKYYNLVTQDHSNKKFLNFNKEVLRIAYNTKLSNIIFLKSKVYFDQNGYFDPSGIIWKGEMAEQRIGDWLPYEYIVEK